ncbi:hypothetical protein IX51_10035 [uncultured archaeon]|nr:hypothetical protein IX51_10035 [uncultured archaeon]
MHQFDYEHVAELREKLIPYRKVEEFVNPHGTDVILDIGAGDGFYSVNFAEKLNGGKVISLEIDKRGTDLLKRRMNEHSVSNVEVVQQDACDEFHFDGYNKAFFSNTFHDIPCRDDLVERFAAVNEENLEIILIEFKKGTLDLGPPEHIRISEEELMNKFTSRGFRFVERMEFSHHYIHKYVKD